MRATFYLVILALLVSWQTPKGDLTVQINGLKKTVGKIQIGLYNNAEKFPDTDGQFKVVFITAISPTTSYTFHNIPFGSYAIAVYHDIDGDDEMDKNFFGVPTEAYGFSNNVKPFLSAPAFEKAMFKFEKTQTIAIELQD